MTDFYADLHIHSRFSRATSKSLTLPVLAAWAQVKGLRVLGTGDLTHPGWRKELSEQLVYDEETALYTLKNPPDGSAITRINLPACPDPVYFMLQGEVNSVYKRDGRVRKIHNIIYMPTLAAAQKFCSRLEAIGNLESDGRPLLNLDARDLLEIVLETDPRAYLVPAHVWTPWFSLFGSRSGFDSIEECFGDLSGHIFALETGLSSDPPMNRLVSSLDNVRLVSNSDAHSAENLGREANLFGGAVHYDGMFSALRAPGLTTETTFLGTIEFYPEEGKYFGDGHRKCGISWSPDETCAADGKCPVCGKPVTVGVLNRVMQLADRKEPVFPDNAQFQALVPLTEILGEIFGLGVKSRKVRDAYAEAIGRFGTELHILNQASVDDLNRFLMPLGSAVARVRSGAVTVSGGYDGTYGSVTVFSDEERRTIGRELGESARPHTIQAQGLSLLGDTIMPKKKPGKRTNNKKLAAEAVQLFSATAGADEPALPGRAGSRPGTGTGSLSAEQAGDGDTVAVLAEQESLGNMPETDEGTLNFIFSDLDADPLTEAETQSLPFLPLDDEPGAPLAMEPETTLNFDQKRAVHVDSEPTLVLAGPGTGKSFTLFARVCHLLKQGCLPRSILVVTFTRNAATEMDKKLLEVIGDGAKLPTIDTLYALALDLWHKTHADVPVLLSEESARQVFNEANTEADQSLLKDAWESVNLARKLLTPVPDVYTEYASRYTAHKSAWNLADYTDLLEFWLEQARSGIFKPLWEYVLVDEIQELSPLARTLVSLIVPASGRGFFGVGDEEQVLYRVPGDTGDSVAFFKEKWSDLTIITLLTGYRSKKGILEVGEAVLHGSPDGAASGLSGAGEETGPLPEGQAATPADTAQSGKGREERNPPRLPQIISKGWGKQCAVESIQQDQAYIHLFRAPTDEDEVRWITDKIAVLLGGAPSTLDYDLKSAEASLPGKVYQPGDIAVLVRTKELGHEIRRALALIGIGVCQPQEDVFWADPRVRIILQLGCRMLGISLAQKEESIVPDCPDKILAKGPLGMAAFFSTVPPFDVLFWHSKPFRELVRVYDQSGGWAGLMTWLHLQNDLELVRPHSNKVQILTFHAAKGMEFPVVFLPCLEEGIMPHAGPLLSGRLAKGVDVEEERRLLYMGVTRAKEALFLSHAAKRCLRGADVRLKASRFLEHLPESLVSVSTLVGKAQYQEHQLHLF